MTIEQWISAASLIVTLVLLVLTLVRKSGADGETLKRLVEFKHAQENINNVMPHQYMPRPELEQRLRRNEHDIAELNRRVNRHIDSGGDHE